VTTVRRKMRLGMRDLDWSAHEAKRMAACRMKKFFRDVGTEKANRNTVHREKISDFSVSHGGNALGFFQDFMEGSFFIHWSLDSFWKIPIEI
jgi:hypothetical protein